MYTVDSDLVAIRGYELRLIRCTLTPSPPSDSRRECQSLDGLINDLLNSIECGNYVQALISEPSSTLVFRITGHDSLPLDAGDRVYSELVDRAESFIRDAASNANERRRRAVLVMCIAVAAFLGFTQSNFTGPLKGTELPKCPVCLDGSDEWDNWARNQLMSAGSDLLGKFSYLQYIVFAKMLLLRIKDLFVEIGSLSWWLARVLLLQQRVLDERSSSLFDLLHVYMGEALQQFGTSEQVLSYWENDLRDGENLAIVSTLHLEAGIMEYHFESAEIAAGLQLSVTGVLGFRTVHQAEPKAQMVLLTNTISSNNLDNCSLTGNGIQTCDSNNCEHNWNLHQSESSEASEILRIPKLLEDDDSKTRSQGIENGTHVTHSLTAIQQAVILACCLLIEKSSRHDELQRWDMAPYIEAIDSQHLFYFTIRCLCNFLRIQWESSRSRTKERALLLMDNLVKHIYESSPAITERIAFSYAVYMPSIPELRKEYGLLLVRCGLIGEAVKEFEDLELWDNLIHCYRLLGKKAFAVELIRKRLSERPNDPRLWCSLGDTTTNDASYEKALEVSNNKSAAAKRYLARSAYKRGDYETSKVLWVSALSINSLYPNGWFELGAAALKAQDIEKALDAFTRAIQLDPENGEAWSYISYLHIIRKKSKEAFIACKEALKFKCSLGDTTTNDASYEKALEVSNNKSAAAKRYLARSAYKRGDYETSKVLWVSALSINSLYPNGWFELGAAALKAQDIEKALDAFTRAIQLDPENGEAWSYISYLHIIRKKSKEAFIACKEALKFKRNNWQLWEIYGNVAVDIGNISQALEGVHMILDVTNNKKVDTELLERIMREVEKRLSTSNVPPLITNKNPKTDQFCIVDSESEYRRQVCGASVAGRSRETEQLLFLLGKVLQQIVKNGSGYGPDIWGLYAKWHRINGDLMMCSEALLKQVRLLQGSDTWKDRDRFKKFAKASLELCQVYVETFSSSGSIKQLSTAEMHLKNIIKQAESFSDTEEFRDLQTCYDEVKIKLQLNA